jgi:hypothetical protein
MRVENIAFDAQTIALPDSNIKLGAKSVPLSAYVEKFSTRAALAARRVA